MARIAADLGGQALERAGLYELERSSREALDRVLAVAPRFQQGATPEAVVVSICAEARRAFGCDVVQIWTPVDDEHLEVTLARPAERGDPSGHAGRLRRLPGSDRGDARFSIDVRAERPGEHARRSAAACPAARPALLAPHPDRDRGASSSGSWRCSGSARSRSRPVRDRRHEAVRRPGRSRDRAGGAAAGTGGDAGAAGRHRGARRGRDPERRGPRRSCGRVSRRSAPAPPPFTRCERTGVRWTSSRVRATRRDDQRLGTDPARRADAAHRRDPQRRDHRLRIARGDHRALPVVRRQRRVLRRCTARRGGPGDRWHLHRLGRGAPVRRQPEPDRQPRPPGGPGARPGPPVRARARIGGPAP